MQGFAKELVVPVGIGTAIVLYSIWRRWYTSGRNPLKRLQGLENGQSTIVPGTTDVRCSPFTPDGAFIGPVDPRVRTLYDMFKLGMETSDDGACLGWRPSKNADYVWRTYSTVLQQAHNLGAALRHRGIKPKSFVALYSRNCPEWATSAMACISQSICIIPLYDTLGADAAAYIIEQSEIELVICDNLEKLNTLMSRRETIPSLKTVVLIDEQHVNDATVTDAAKNGIDLISYSELVREGVEHPMALTLPEPDDLYIVCYTSGTTGNPKGVMLTHKNVVMNVSCLFFVETLYGGQLTIIEKNSPVISYLPLSHMFEQIVHWSVFSKGAKIGYLFGDIRGLTADLKTLKPTFFPTVPRLLNRLYDTINGTLTTASPLKKMIFQFAFNRKKALLQQGIITKDSIWDKLVFSKMQAELGGRVTFIATGSAPISEQVLEMCRITLGAEIVEAYGQTECTAIATSTYPGEAAGGHVGGPAPVSHIKLVDVPELNCYAKDGKGEVCIKGPCVTTGYYKEPEKTRETIDEEGWLHTGDVGQWQPNGALKIIDRKKHIFKLAQGEYVAPEKIENVYSKNAYVAQIFVDGNSLERWLVAIVVPEEKLIMGWFESEFGTKSDFATVCKDPRTNKFVLSQLQAIGKENKLNSIEQVKSIKLEWNAFTLENNLLTPTMKAKRPALRLHYQQDIDELYKQ